MTAENGSVPLARLADFRVAHIVPALFGSKGIVGGAERYALELAKNMANKVPTKLISFGETDDQISFGALKVQIIGHPYYVKGQQTNPISVRLLRSLQDVDVVHCHQQHVIASSLAALYCRLTGKRVFVSDLGGGGWDLSSYVNTDRWYHGHLHISQYSRSIYGHDGLDRARVIYGGVDTMLFSPGGDVSARSGRVLFVGRLMPHKGIDDLIKAMPPGVRLDVIGTPYHERFFADLQKLAEGRDVSFRHNCSDEDIVKAYQTAICIVLPSVYRTCYGEVTKVPELLGQTLIEGMACGTPAICTDVASMPEVVTDGITGFVVPPNDPRKLGERIATLAGSPEMVQQMGAAARQRVLDNFTWSQVVDRCVKIYGEN